MKISVNYLKQIIKEEVERTLEEITVDEGEENLEEVETIEEVNASDVANAGTKLGIAKAKGQTHGKGGINAEKARLRALLAQSGAKRPNDPDYADKMRNVAHTRAGRAEANRTKNK